MVNPFITAFADRLRDIGLQTHENIFDPRNDQGESNFVADNFPYVVVSPGLDYEFSGNGRFQPSVADLVDGIELPIRVTMSGLTIDSVLIIQKRIRPVMNRADLAVPGWTETRLKMTPLSRPAEDTTITVGTLSPWFAVDEYRLIASRA